MAKNSLNIHNKLYIAAIIAIIALLKTPTFTTICNDFDCLGMFVSVHPKKELGEDFGLFQKTCLLAQAKPDLLLSSNLASFSLIFKSYFLTFYRTEDLGAVA